MRVMVVWCPDWPVVAALADEGLPTHLPAAVFHANIVQAGNAAARTLGVRRGMRRRDAVRCGSPPRTSPTEPSSRSSPLPWRGWPRCA